MFKTNHKGVTRLCFLWILFQWSMLVNYVCSPGGEDNKWNISNDLQYCSTHIWARDDSRNSSISRETTPSLYSIRVLHLPKVSILSGPFSGPFIGWEIFPFRKKLFIQERTHFIYWATLWVLVTYLDYCKGNLSFLSILQFLVKVQDHPCLHYHVSNFLKGLHLKQAADGRIRTVQMKLANLIFQWISHGQQLSLWQFNWNLIFFCWFSYQKVMLLK